MPKHHLLRLCLAVVGSLHAAHAADPDLPELSFDLSTVPAGECRLLKWRLPHVELPVSVCHEANRGHEPAPEPKTGPQAAASLPKSAPQPDLAALQTRLVALRERWVNPALAQAVFSTQAHLDGLPHRSLHPAWRVWVALGTFGCVPQVHPQATSARYTDPCNQHAYDPAGRPLGADHPALLVPPYTLANTTLVLGRLPDTVPRQPALLPVDWEPLAPPQGQTAAAASAPTAGAEQLTRAARWGHLSRVASLLGLGVPPDATAPDGSTPLLAAVQWRQPEVLALLLAHGANPAQGYPNGPTALELVRLVSERHLESLLTQAMAKAAHPAPTQSMPPTSPKTAPQAKPAS